MGNLIDLPQNRAGDGIGTRDLLLGKYNLPIFGAECHDISLDFDPVQVSSLRLFAGSSAKFGY